MYSSDDPLNSFALDDRLNNMPSETRQRVEDALRSLGNGSFQGMNPVFVTQYTEVLGQLTHSNSAWAHWEYSADEWALFDKIDWGKASRKLWRVIGLCALVDFLIVGVLSWVFLIAQPFTSDNLPIVIIPAFLLLIPSILLIAFYGSADSEAKKRRKARQNQAQPHKVTFSEKGVWEAGTYFPLNEIFVDLKDVKLTSQPTVLHFKIENTSIGSNSQASFDTLRVLVPRGHEAEAAQLMQRFRTEVIERQKKGTTPPEPV